MDMMHWLIPTAFMALVAPAQADNTLPLCVAGLNGTTSMVHRPPTPAEISGYSSQSLYLAAMVDYWVCNSGTWTLNHSNQITLSLSAQSGSGASPTRASLPPGMPPPPQP